MLHKLLPILQSVWTDHRRSTLEIIDEEDERIRSLKNGFDEDVYNAVVTALNELNEIIDEEDEKIKSLKNGFQEDVYNVVVTALNELNVYNPSCMYPIPELWNQKENRKAILKEGVEFLLKEWKAQKPKKRVYS
ncbi:factor of DNA methylation 4 [Tanacetum coccineum]